MLRGTNLSAWLVVGLCGAAAAPIASAQIFQRAYGTSVPEVAFDIINRTDCTYQTIGQRSPTGDLSTVHTVKYDSNGAVLWNKQYRIGQGHSAGYTIEEARDGTLLLGCETYVSGVIGKLILRTTSAGALIWGRFAPGTAFASSSGDGSLGVSVRELSSLKIASVNRQDATFSVGRVGILSVFNSNGTVVYDRAYIPSGPFGVSIELDFAEVREAKTPANSGEMLIVGNLREATGQRGALAMRVDASGNIIWARKYVASTGSIYADGFDLDDSGDIIFSGRRNSGTMIVAKLDSLTGTPIWASTSFGFLNGFQAVNFTPERTIVIAGTRIEGSAPEKSSAGLTEFSSTGALLKRALYGPFVPGKVVRGEGVVRSAPWGGYALAASTNDFGAGDSDIYFIKTYSTFITACRGLFEPATATPLTLEMSTPSIQVVSLTAQSTPTVTSPDFALTTTTACFTQRCLGDLNGDGLVDDADFVIFAFAYDVLVCPTSPALYSCCPADLNNDGMVDDADFVLFATGYDALICS